jgi:hypothetical protein
MEGRIALHVMGLMEGLRSVNGPGRARCSLPLRTELIQHICHVFSIDHTITIAIEDLKALP